jgi:hypothetical protein
MTIVLDHVSEPGSWARAMGRGCVPNAVDFDPVDASENAVDDAVARHTPSYQPEGLATS